MVSIFPVVLEHGLDNWSVYAPDVAGCVSSGKTEEEALKSMREALTIHFEGLISEGLPVPNPFCEPITGLEPKDRVEYLAIDTRSAERLKV